MTGIGDPEGTCFFELGKGGIGGQVIWRAAAGPVVQERVGTAVIMASLGGGEQGLHTENAC